LQGRLTAEYLAELAIQQHHDLLVPSYNNLASSRTPQQILYALL
jgi:hypothetical protein